MNVHHSRLRPSRLVAAACVAACAASSAIGGNQTVFSEDFEDMGFVPIGQWGPAGLLAGGWSFVNTTVPLGTTGYFTGCCWENLIDPLSGEGYLAASFSSAAGEPAQYSNWAILPAIPDQQADDMFSFYTISSDTSPFASVSLEVRYSPTGGTDVGDGPGANGDFTQVLFFEDSLPNYNSGIADGWTYWEFPIPGPGRIAIRQVGTSSMYFGIEDVVITRPGPPAGALPEDFENLGGLCGEGPCALVDNGWTFVDQSVPPTAPAWEPNGAIEPIDPQGGFGFMKSFSAAGGVSSGGMNNWAILPDVLEPGDTLSFFATGGMGAGGGLEVRYSPTGSIGTGSGLSGVGDFTEVLVAAMDLEYGAWQLVTVVIPGGGRVALRATQPSIPSFSGGRVVAVDSMTVNTEPAGPVLPQPGETVTWTSAMSPVVIDYNASVPVGATLLVEPGVEINIGPESTLTIAGEAFLIGVPNNPITIVGSGGASVVNGSLDGYSEWSWVEARDGLYATTIASNCELRNATLDVLKIDDSTFIDASIAVTDANLSVVGCDFAAGGISILRGYLHIDDVFIDGGAISLTREDAAQTIFFDHLTLINSPVAAIHVGGGSACLGSNNIIANNLYPLDLNAGLAPGSVLPAAGNLNNVVRLGNTGGPNGRHELPAIAIPYFLDDSYSPGAGVVVHGGARFLATSGGRFWATSGPMKLMGTPGLPVTFEGLGGSSWLGVRWNGIHGSKAEHVVVRDAEWGFLADSAILPVDSCLLEGNVTGSRTSNSGLSIFRNSRILDNLQIGVEGTNLGSVDLDGRDNPNSIAGNGQGLVEDDTVDARGNWWGDPSGPNHPSNPGGQGDSAPASATVTPFLSTAPQATDAPPVVRVEPVNVRLETNSRILLHWTASDDGRIVSQRILFDDLNNPIGAQVLADDLPPGQRSAVLTVPESAFFHQGTFFVEAVDDAGQTGHDLIMVSIANDPDDAPDDFEFASDLTGPFVTGEDAPLDEPLGYTYAVQLDAMNTSVSLGAGVLGLDVPYASTDTARLVAFSGSTGRAFFSESFTIRPPAVFDDAAPVITLSTPSAGSIEGGSTTTISWAASDDEGVRAIDIQVSADGGRTWQWIARRLAGDATHYDWPTPPTDAAIGDVLVRVIAWDVRFQSSSSTSQSLVITPGDAPVFGDLDGDGVVNASDLSMLLAAWGPCRACPTDLDGDGDVDAADLALLLGAWG